MVDRETGALFARTRRDLEAWHPSRTSQDELRLEYLEFLRATGPAALQRDGGPEHVTASCFAVTVDLTKVLLAFHRKAQRWLQLGGHLELDDESCAAGAHREAEEEGGLSGLRLAEALPADLDRHRLVGRFGSCATHWDIGYLAFAEEPRTPQVSDESEAVAWWSLDDLREHDPVLARRLDLVLEGVAGSRNSH